jgi:hypothetical protein
MMYVASVHFKYFRGMLQVFHTDVAKVDRDIAYVAMVIHVCCKRLSLMFYLFFHIYVANVFLWMLHQTYVTRAVPAAREPVWPCEKAGADKGMLARTRSAGTPETNRPGLQYHPTVSDQTSECHPFCFVITHVTDPHHLEFQDLVRVD